MSKICTIAATLQLSQDYKQQERNKHRANANHNRVSPMLQSYCFDDYLFNDLWNDRRCRFVLHLYIRNVVLGCCVAENEVKGTLN